MVKMSKDQKRWQAEEDAYTLIRAEAIKMDRGRVSAAKREAKKMATEKKKDATAALKVAKPTKPVKKKTTKRKKK